MTTHSEYEPLEPLPAPSPAPRGRSWPMLGAKIVLLVVAVAASWVSQRQIDVFLDQLDGDALRAANSILNRSLEDQRGHVLSQVGVLAEDTRIRSTVMMPNLDEETIRDVLKDLIQTSGAGLIAVLDVNGKVKAVTGIEGLQKVDLGSSSVVKAAVQRSSAHIWTFPEQLLAIGVAPIRSQDQVHAFLVMGFEAAKPALAAITGAIGVSGAVLIGDKIVASSTDDATSSQAFRDASRHDGDQDLVVQGGDRLFLAHASRVTDSVAAAKVVWMVPWHHQIRRINQLKLAIWTPSFAAALILALTLVVSRRDGKVS